MKNEGDGLGIEGIGFAKSFIEWLKDLFGGPPPPPVPA